MPGTPRPSVVTDPFPARRTYRLDPARCLAAFTTRHLFGLAKVDGSVTVVDGHVTIGADPADPRHAGP